MAFATKYRCTFESMVSCTWNIDFQWDGWGGGITSLTPGVKPLVLRYNTDDKHQTIVGLSADIQLVWETALDSFFTEAEQVVRVYIFNDNGNVFLGFLVPHQYYKRFSSKPYYANFTATDQLNRLNEITFRDSSGDPYYGIDSGNINAANDDCTDLAAISEILSKTGYTHSTRENVNIYEVDYSHGVTNSPISQTYFFPEMYYDDANMVSANCGEVLSDILKKYGARIFQSQYIWHIQRPNAMWSPHTYRNYTAANPMVYLSNSTGYQTWNRVSQGGKWLADPELEMLPRLGRAEITAQPGRKTNLIKNSTFKDYTQFSSSNGMYWDDSMSFSYQDGYIALGDETSTQHYIKTTVYTHGIKNIRFVMEFSATIPNVSSAVMKFLFEFNGYNYTAAGWAASGTYDFDVFNDVGDMNHAYGVFSIDFPLIDEYNVWSNPTTTFDITIYRLLVNTIDVDTHYWVRDVRLEVEYFENAYGSALNKIYTFNNTATANEVKREDLRQISSDIISTTTFPYLYPGDTFPYLHQSTTNRAAATQWFLLGHPTVTPSSEDANATGTAVTIQDLLARQYVEGAWLPRQRIRGTLRPGANFYNYHQALVDNEITDAYGYPKVFIPLDMEHDARSDLWTGTWEEVSPIYTDTGIEWDGYGTYESGVVTTNNIYVESTPVSGTDSASTDDYTCILGEVIRIVARVYDVEDGSDLPNYAFDGNTGTLALGYNYLEFRATTGAKAFSINHTDGETADCQVQVWMYSLTGL